MSEFTNTSIINDSEFLNRIRKMSQNIKSQVEIEEEPEPEKIEDNSKLTQITFNNFDGDKIKKHNDSLKKDSDLDKPIEEEVEVESIDENDKSDNESQKVSVGIKINNRRTRIIPLIHI